MPDGTFLKEPIIGEYVRDDAQWYIDQTYREATLEQSRTTVRVDIAGSPIYQPYYIDKRTDFEELRLDMIEEVRNRMNDDDLWIPKDVWSLYYAENHHADAHVHPNTCLSVIWYPLAEDGCGTLEFFDPDMTVEPKDNMLVIFDGYHRHGVFPNVQKGARRVCLVFNVFSLSYLKLHPPENKRGWYDVDVKYGGPYDEIWEQILNDN